MARHAPAALIAALLVATGLAFLYTESLKLETSPIRQTRVTKLFSPTCLCATSRARIAFRVGKPDVVSVSVVDASGSDVRLLVAGRPASGPVAVLWNGKDDEGRVVPDGVYRGRVRLDLIEKTFTLPNPIRVDTKRPSAAVVSVKPRVFSPDGDRRADRIVVRYTLDERARAILSVDGTRRVVGARLRRTGELRWYGKVAGSPLPAGSYPLTLVAEDPAGNRSAPVAAGPVRIRYLELVEPLLRARAGGWVRVRVSTDSRRVAWRLAGRTGIATAPVFRIRAPSAPRRYLLVLTAHGHQAGGTVVVAAPPG